MSVAMGPFSAWPRFHWDSIRTDYSDGPEDPFRLTIENSSPHALMIDRIWIRPRGYTIFPARIDAVTRSTVDDIVARLRTGHGPLVLAPGETQSFRINSLDSCSWCLVAIVWHRPGLLPFRLAHVRHLTRTVTDAG